MYVVLVCMYLLCSRYYQIVTTIDDHYLTTMHGLLIQHKALTTPPLHNLKLDLEGDVQQAGTRLASGSL